MISTYFNLESIFFHISKIDSDSHFATMYSQNRNYSAHHEAQKELSRTAHTECNDQKIGFAKQDVNAYFQGFRQTLAQKSSYKV